MNKEMVVNFEPRKTAFSNKTLESLVTTGFEICFFILFDLLVFYKFHGEENFWLVLCLILLFNMAGLAYMVYIASKESCKVENEIVTIRNLYGMFYWTSSFAMKDILQIHHKKYNKLTGQVLVTIITYLDAKGKEKTIRYVFHEPKKFDDLIRQKNPTCLFV